MSRGSRVYLALYFNVDRAEDLDLLTLLYALPLTRRGPAIKQILRAHLAAYLGAHHPDRSPLDRQTVRDIVAARARPSRRRRRGERAVGVRRGAPSHPPVSIPEVSAPRTAGQVLDELTDDAARTPTGNAEIRLDRLLRSFLR